MDGKVLLVENDEKIVAALRSHLMVNGLDVSVAGNGEAGLWKSVAEKPQLIILNATVPLVSGWDMCAEVKRNPETRDIPVFILVNQVDAVNNAKTFLMRGDACFSAPEGLKSCVAAAAQLLGKD